MNIILFILNSLFILINTRKYDNIKADNNEKYLEFSFERNLTLSESASTKEIFKSLFYNQIYIKIKVGTEQMEIPFYLFLQQYSFIIESSEVSTDQVKGLYNESKSKTYIPSSKIETFMVMDMSEGILSQDMFYIKNNNTLLDFYLCKKNNDNSHITEGGKIGFKLEPESAQSEEAFFITNLKHKNLISNLIFSIKYDTEKDDDKGKFYIGAYPHIFDDNKYKEQYLTFDNAAQIYTKIEWALNFQEIKLGTNTIESNCKAFLYLEIGYIIGTKKFFDLLLSSDIWKKYFNNNNKCHKTIFNIDDFEKNIVDSKLADEYTLYYCDKDIDVTKINIGELIFIDKAMSYSFNFSFAELWEEKNNNYKYFKIIQHEYYNEYWYFGKPFFKKFQMIFDYDNKKIGLYTKIFENGQPDNNKKHNIYIYILIIIGLIIVIAGLIFVLMKNWKKITKRKRANELLDDNYDYETKEPNVKK